MRIPGSIGLVLVATFGWAHAQTVSGSGLSLTPPGNANFANDTTGTRISVFPVTPLTGDGLTSPDSLQIGGLSDFNDGGSLVIRGAPYGFLDTGSLLSIVSTPHSLFNSRAGINSGYSDYPAGLIKMATDSDFNSVNFYNQTTALPPRMTLSSGVTYTPTQIQLATPLTQTQLGQLRRSMWVTTNSIDPTMAQVTMATLANAAKSGDSSLTLTGAVNVAVGSYVRGFHAGINGPTVRVTSVASANGNTVIGLSSPLVDGGTDASPVTSYASGTSYGFMTFNTPVVTAQAANVGSSTLVLSGVFNVPAGTTIPSTNPGIAAGTTVVSASVSGNTTVLTLSNALITDANNDASYPAGTTYYLGMPYVLPAGQHPPTITYGTTITGWDSAGGTYITVNGWTVPGGNRPITGQVPSSLLDPGMPYTTPTAYIGTPTTASINNWVQSYDPSPSVPASPVPSEGESSRIQQFEGLELDQWNFAKHDYEASFRGLTIGYSPLASVTSGGVSHSVLPSTDSYDLELAGNMPTLLRFTGGATANYMVGESLLVKGNGGVAGATGNTGELFEHSAYMDGADNFRLTDWLQKDSNVAGAKGGSMRLGLILNGAQGTVTTPQSQLVFNVPGVGPGSIGLFGYNGGGVYVDATGNADLSPNSALLLKTPSNAAGGAVSTDNSGDLVLGTKMSGAQTISTAPLVAQNGLIIGGSATINTIAAPSMLVKGNAGVSGAVGSTGELFEQSGFIDGANNMRLVDWLQQDSAVIGAGGGSMHLGLIIDGAQGTVGTPQSQIIFDPAGFGTGSIGLSGYHGGGLVVNAVGNATVTSGGSLIFQTGSGASGTALTADATGNLRVSSAVANGGGVAVPRGSTLGVNTPTMTTFATNPTVGASSATWGWNCSNGGGEACIQVSGDAGSTQGFAIYQDSSANTLSSASKIFGVDRTGTTTISGQFYAGSNIYAGANAALILRTASGTQGGTISSDSAGDVVLNSAASSGKIVASKPVVLANLAFRALPATGTPGAELFCTDCLKPSETSGSGTGMVVFDDGHSHWVTTAGTVAAN